MTLAAASLLMQMGLSSVSSWVAQPIGTQADLHIARAVDPSVAWAAGEAGMVARTADGGKTWWPNQIITCTTCRISAFVVHDGESAIAATASRPARIYFTRSAGSTWTIGYESDQHDVHLAGMAFFDTQRGIAVSDPMEGRYHLLRTDDGGASWTQAPDDALPRPLPGEHLSEVSGGAVVATSLGRAFVAVTGGGPFARVFRTEDGGATWKAVTTRLATINALAFATANEGIAVGSGRGRTNMVRTVDGGRSWSEPAVAGMPRAMEGVSYVPGTAGRSVVAVGPGGSTLSTDGGATWRVMDRLPARGVSFAGTIDAGWKVGAGGAIQKLLRGRSAERVAASATPVPVDVAPPLALGRREAAPEAPPGATPTPLGARPLKKGTTNLSN